MEECPPCSIRGIYAILSDAGAHCIPMQFNIDISARLHVDITTSHLNAVALNCTLKSTISSIHMTFCIYDKIIVNVK